jgi:hypothetical protein
MEISACKLREHLRARTVDGGRSRGIWDLQLTASIRRLGKRMCPGNRIQGDRKIRAANGMAVAFLPVSFCLAD